MLSVQRLHSGSVARVERGNNATDVKLLTGWNVHFDYINCGNAFSSLKDIGSVQ
jgi:hypothetical protein